MLAFPALSFPLYVHFVSCGFHFQKLRPKKGSGGTYKSIRCYGLYGYFTCLCHFLWIVDYWKNKDIHKTYAIWNKHPTLLHLRNNSSSSESLTQGLCNWLHSHAQRVYVDGTYFTMCNSCIFNQFWKTQGATNTVNLVSNQIFCLQTVQMFKK